MKFRFWISGKTQKWSFQREYNSNIEFLIAKISFQLKKRTFWKNIWKNQKYTQNWNFYFLLDHFDGPQLFVGDRTSLENTRNGVSRSSRYCFKKIPSKNIIFSQSYCFLQNTFFDKKSVRTWPAGIPLKVEPISWMSQKKIPEKTIWDWGGSISAVAGS